MASLFPFPSSKSPVKATSSVNWSEVPGGKSLSSMVSKLEITAYLVLLFPSKTKLLPPVYQISSGPARGSSDNPSQGFVQWSTVSRQTWKGRELSRVVIVMPGFSISTTWYLRVFWSDIHKCPLPFRNCFTWWLVKIVSLLPKESFKASCIRTAIVEKCCRQGGQPRVVGLSLGQVSYRLGLRSQVWVDMPKVIPSFSWT